MDAYLQIIQLAEKGFLKRNILIRHKHFEVVSIQ